MPEATAGHSETHDLLQSNMIVAVFPSFRIKSFAQKFLALLSFSSSGPAGLYVPLPRMKVSKN